MLPCCSGASGSAVLAVLEPAAFWCFHAVQEPAALQCLLFLSQQFSGAMLFVS